VLPEDIPDQVSHIRHIPVEHLIGIAGAWRTGPGGVLEQRQKVLLPLLMVMVMVMVTTV
jgi:hypothetical protein